MSVLDQLGVSRKQAVSIATANADASRSQINLWHGAVRSGKTVGSLVKFLMKVADGYDDPGEVVVIGRTRDTVHRNLIAPLQDPGMFGPFAEQVQYNRGAPTATILGQQVHVIGASDVRAENVIRGMTIKRSYCDELTLMAEEFVNQLIARHSVPGAWLGATTNPDGPRHHVKLNYIDRADDMGHKVFHFSLDDNRKYLPDGYIEALSAQYTGLWHDRFVRGLWTMADGIIYDMFDPARHVVDELPPIVRTLALGIDYGTTNPTRGIALGFGQDGRLYLTGEWAPNAGVDAQLTADLRRWIADAPAPGTLFVDPAAASFKLQLHHDGMGPVYNAHNNVTDGIRTVASLLASGRLLIHSSCTNLLDEIPGYVWDAKASADGVDKPVKVNDHAVDAMRYAVASSRYLWQPLLPDLVEVP